MNNECFSIVPQLSICCLVEFMKHYWNHSVTRTLQHMYNKILQNGLKLWNAGSENLLIYSIDTSELWKVSTEDTVD